MSPFLPHASVLEIASGSGQHGSYICSKDPSVIWQPSDITSENITSIDFWGQEYQLTNLKPAITLDCLQPETWPDRQYDLIVNINMIHISPWEATVGLFTCANRLLAAQGKLFTYGPYFQRNTSPAPSNIQFDQWLKNQDPRWGVRFLEEVVLLGESYNFQPQKVVPMPANNLAIIFSKIERC